jgi:hypothetical protein
LTTRSRYDSMITMKQVWYILCMHVCAPTPLQANQVCANTSMHVTRVTISPSIVQRKASPTQQTHMWKAAILVQTRLTETEWQQPPASTASDGTPAVSRASHSQKKSRASHSQQKPKLPTAAEKQKEHPEVYSPTTTEVGSGWQWRYKTNRGRWRGSCAARLSAAHLINVLLYPQNLWHLPVTGSCHGVSGAQWLDSQHTGHCYRQRPASAHSWQMLTCVHCRPAMIVLRNTHTHSTSCQLPSCICADAWSISLCCSAGS